jgi:hypothetical protein
MIKFTDGVEFDTSGPSYHLEHKFDGWYVVGKGMLCPVNSREEGLRLIKEWEQNEIHRR